VNLGGALRGNCTMTAHANLRHIRASRPPRVTRPVDCLHRRPERRGDPERPGQSGYVGGHELTAKGRTGDAPADEDAELVRRVAGGDRAAFERLYDRYAVAAFGIARRVCGDSTLAEDVV